MLTEGCADGCHYQMHQIKQKNGFVRLDTPDEKRTAEVMDAEINAYAIEERAAILEYDAGLPRKEAENKAAQMHGFKDWREYVKSTTSRN
jgi:hypothetical protein